MATPVWVRKTQNKLHNTINKYNKNLAPLGLHVKKFGNPDMFEIVYGNGNRQSSLRVNVNPYLLTANLASGNTHPNNRGKGVGLALRTFAAALLRNAGYVKVWHHGVTLQNRNNASLNKTDNLPISTYIVRKYLGFKPYGREGNYRSIWRASSPRAVKRVKNAEGTARNKLKALLTKVN